MSDIAPFYTSQCTNSTLLRGYWIDLLNGWCVTLTPDVPWVRRDVNIACYWLISKLLGRAHMCLGIWEDHFVGTEKSSDWLFTAPVFLLDREFTSHTISSFPRKVDKWPGSSLKLLCVITCEEFEIIREIYSLECPINVMEHRHVWSLRKYLTRTWLVLHQFQTILNPLFVVLEYIDLVFPFFIRLWTNMHLSLTHDWIWIHMHFCFLSLNHFIMIQNRYQLRREVTYRHKLCEIFKWIFHDQPQAFPD